MDVDEIQRLAEGLVKLMEESKISEITVDEGDVRISLRRQAGQVTSTVEEKGAESPAQQAESRKKEHPASWKKITAPLVGTFYQAPTPGDNPFVKIDDEVDEGQTVCIVEAMKLMNEITVEERGVIKDILVEDGHTVEFGQTLFFYDPTG